MNEVSKTRFYEVGSYYESNKVLTKSGSYYESNKVLTKSGSYKRKTFWGPKKSKNNGALRSPPSFAYGSSDTLK